MKNTWEEEKPKLESNQETPALSKVETVELDEKWNEQEKLPKEDCPYWEE